jgi:hypothetical protein
VVASISEFVHREWRLFYIQYSARKSESGCDYFKGRKYEVGRVYSKLDQGIAAASLIYSSPWPDGEEMVLTWEKGFD